MHNKIDGSGFHGNVKIDGSCFHGNVKIHGHHAACMADSVVFHVVIKIC